MARAAALTLLSLALAAALAGCAMGTASQRPTPTATSAPTSIATTPQESPTAQASAQACKPEAGSIAVGDLAMSSPSVFYGFNADYMLPDGLPTQPLAVTIQNNGTYVQGVPLQSRTVVQESSFVVTLCNTSAMRTYHVTSFGSKLTSLTPYTGSLNALNACAFLYGRPNGFGGECASGFEPDAEPAFTFPAGVAPPLAVTQTPAAPLALAPDQSLSVSFDAHLSASQVIADFQLGFGIDGSAVTYPAALRTQPVVIAPIARRWSGDYCRAPQVQAQIPATIPAQTYYVCPKV